MKRTSAALDKAWGKLRSGDLEAAGRSARRIVRVDPQQADGWHLLGMIACQAGRREEAVVHLLRAVALDGSKAEFHADLGVVYFQAGLFDEAVARLEQAIQIAPMRAEFYVQFGLMLKGRGNVEGAKRRLQQASRLRPDDAEIWNELGTIHQSLGELEPAAESFGFAASLARKNADARYNLGNIRLAQGRLTEAVEAYSAALKRQPDFVEALNNLGTALRGLGRIEQAIECYRLATTFRPEFAAAHSNLGTLLGSLGRLDEAEVCYRMALRHEPENAAALNNLGVVLQAREKPYDAETCFREAIKRRPDYADAHGNLAGALQMIGRMAEAGSAYRRAVDLQPNRRWMIQWATMLPPVYQSREELTRCRDYLTENVENLRKSGFTLDPSHELLPVNFLLAYQGLNDRPLNEAIAKLYIRENVGETSLPVNPVRDRDGRLSIGILSKFLRDHTIGDLMRGLMEKLSRDEFHITVFPVGDARDEVANSIRQAASQVILLPENVPVARGLVAGAGLDVLFFPDIGMDPLSYTLAFSRLAPVQCVTWGHPVTTGIPNVDYFVSSELLEGPGAETHYSERLVRLPTLPTYYDKPRLSAEKNVRAAFGLPEDRTIYLCPQSLFKFHPDFDPLLAEILQCDPRGVLVLIEGAQRHWTELLSHRLQGALGSEFERVIWVPRVNRGEFLRLLKTADIVLDPPHFGGGNTTFQALGAGIPVVTLPSELMRGRITAGCYRKMQLTSCIASSPDQYVRGAIRLGTDHEFRAHIHQEILSRNSILFEDISAVRAFERFFRESAGTPRVGRAA